ncbi:MAG TPA: diaminopimelate epimerase [Acidimicrobiales bacterium]|nr:diaminopimelate epimerase [Acidimicrobiales bacterium]
MTWRSLQKWHGAGNDFLVDVKGDGEQFWTPDRVRAVCDRTTGVGADGLLVASSSDPVAMTLFNADGSIAEMSGNGARCFAGAIRRVTGATWNELLVDTMGGLKTVQLEMSSETAGRGSVAMGEVTLGDDLDGAWGVAYVGNPHVVVRDDPAMSDAAREELAEKLAAQLGGANVEFATVLGDGLVSLRVIERGVGWTQACGTGTCAVAAILRRDGLAKDRVTVENPGGTLEVQFDGDQVTLSGPLQFIADVEWLAV